VAGGRIRGGFGPLVPRQELAQLGDLRSTEGGDLRRVPQTRAGFDAGRGIIPTPTTNLRAEVERLVIQALRLG
jgi:hypothetical protein